MSRKPNLTPGHTAAQTIAADPTQPVWVSANAGTGKTHVLIERILRLLLAGTPPGKILCLTYTKAAAAEVATRLSTRLGHWAAGGGEALARDLKKLLGKPASEKEAERAGVLFAATLETPEGLRIRTIHSFCESLLGRFPVEARLAPHFSVLDERQAREIRIEARNRLLAGGAAAAKEQHRHYQGKTGDRCRSQPQHQRRALEWRLQQHEIAVARDYEINHRRVAVAGDQPFADDDAEVLGQIGVGIVDGLVLAHQAAEPLGYFAGAHFKHRVGQYLFRVDGPGGSRP